MPPKSSKQYWLDREQAEDAAMEMVGDVIAREQYVVKQQSAIFDAALREMDRELDILLKDVGQNAIDRAKMQKPLTPKELSAWSARQRDRLDRLISQYGDKEGRKRFGAENAKTAKQDRANRIVRRQEALKQSMEAISSNAAAKSESVTQKALEIEARNGVDAFKKQFGVNTQVKFNTVSKGEINALIKTNWKGGNYSSRIWKDRDEMVKDLERAINQGVANGWSVQRIAKEVQHHVSTGKQSAERIARTEMNRISNAAELASYKANGVHYYRFMATQDARTCPVCGELHDKVFAVDNASTGDNFPPVHPNCRCRTIGSFVDEEGNEDDKWLDELVDELEVDMADTYADVYDRLTDNSLPLKGKPKEQTELASDAMKSAVMSKITESMDEVCKTDNEVQAASYNKREYKALLDVYVSGKYRKTLENYEAYLQKVGTSPTDAAYILKSYTIKRFIDAPPPAVFPCDKNMPLIRGGEFHRKGVAYLKKNGGVGSEFIALHEVGHAWDYLALRGAKMSNGNLDNEIISAVKDIKRRILRRGGTFTLFGKKWTADEWKANFYPLVWHGQLYNIYLPEFFDMAANYVKKKKGWSKNDWRGKDAALRIFDAMQDVLGFEYGTGHGQMYCKANQNTGKEAVAQIHVSLVEDLDFLEEPLKELWEVLKWRMMM